jgi:hypothetical protein
MRTPPKGGTYGMGWRIDEREDGLPTISHNGELLTYNSTQTLIPGSGYGIAVVTNTSMWEDDSGLITEGLVELAEGRTPQALSPFSRTADPVLAILTLLSAGLGVLGVRRSRRWAQRRAARPSWRGVLRLVPYAVPIAFFVTLPDLLGLLMNGRAGTLAQVTYVWPALFIWAASGALAGAAVIVTRVYRWFRVRRPASHRPDDLRMAQTGPAANPA